MVKSARYPGRATTAKTGETLFIAAHRTTTVANKPGYR
jgi:hypothetical protein